MSSTPQRDPRVQIKSMGRNWTGVASEIDQQHQAQIERLWKSYCISSTLARTFQFTQRGCFMFWFFSVEGFLLFLFFFSVGLVLGLICSYLLRKINRRTIRWIVAIPVYAIVVFFCSLLALVFKARYGYITGVGDAIGGLVMGAWFIPSGWRRYKQARENKNP